jgi:hypothetical protein
MSIGCCHDHLRLFRTQRADRLGDVASHADVCLMEINLGATQSHASSFQSSAEPIGNFIGRTRINFVKV